MKKSEAEKAADLHYGEVTKKLWVDKTITTNRESFVEGVKYAIEQADRLSIYADTDIRTTSLVVKLSELAKLLEPTP